MLSLAITVNGNDQDMNGKDVVPEVGSVNALMIPKTIDSDPMTVLKVNDETPAGRVNAPLRNLDRNGNMHKNVIEPSNDVAVTVPKGIDDNPYGNEVGSGINHNQVNDGEDPNGSGASSQNSCVEDSLSLNIGVEGDEEAGNLKKGDFVDEDDPRGVGAGVPIPEAMPAEPGFLERFSRRLMDMLGQDEPNFQEFEAVAEDLTNCIKKGLNFKSSPGDGEARPTKVISSDDAKSIQRLYRRNSKKALRLIYNEESDFLRSGPGGRSRSV